MSVNSFNSKSTLKVGSKEYEIYRLDALDHPGFFASWARPAVSGTALWEFENP